MQRNALLIQPPIVLPKDFIDYPYFADYGLMTCAQMIKDAGFEVVIRNSLCLEGSRCHTSDNGFLLGLPYQDFIETLPEEDFDIVIIGLDVFQNPPNLSTDYLELIKETRKRYPSSMLVLADCLIYGMHYNDYDGSEILVSCPQVDLIIKYIGEEYFSNPASIIKYKGQRMVIEAPLIRKRGGFPIPSNQTSEFTDQFLESCFSNDKLANPYKIGAGSRAIVGSIGCIYRCIFCSNYPKIAPIYRVTSIEKIEHFILSSCPKKLIFLDSVANLRKDFADLILMMQKYDIGFEFPNGLRADLLPNYIIDLLAERISLLSISCESANQSALIGKIGKKLKLEEVERVANYCKTLKLPLLVHFIVGFPWETDEDISNTLSYALWLFETTGAIPSIQYAYPLVGSSLYKECIENGIRFELGMQRFQKRPSITPPNVNIDEMVKQVDALRVKVQSSQRKLILIKKDLGISNSFIYKKGKEIKDFILDKDRCGAKSLGLHSLNTSRVVIVKFSNIFRLCWTETRDFCDTTIREVVHKYGQLYLQKDKNIIKDFYSLSQLIISPVCLECSFYQSCCLTYVPVERSLFEEDENLIRSILRKMTGKILDVGSGSSPYIESIDMLKERVTYHALDKDPDSLKKISALVSITITTRIENFCDGEYDNIIVIRSINHFDDVEMAIKNIIKMLKSGGKLMIVDSIPLPIIGREMDRSLFEHKRNWSSYDCLEHMKDKEVSLVFHRPVSKDTCNQWFLVFEKR